MTYLQLWIALTVPWSGEPISVASAPSAVYWSADYLRRVELSPCVVTYEGGELSFSSQVDASIMQAMKGPAQ